MTSINGDQIAQELPIQLQVSFRKVYEYISQYASQQKKNHPFHIGAVKVKKEVEQFPFLIDGFADFSLIDKHREIIDTLLEPIFPEILQLNEIKAAMIPFSFKSFKLSTRFQNILKNAGDDFELKIRNFEPDYMYREACAFILQTKYGYTLDLSRPFYFDIPNQKTGILHHYRVAFNADFCEFIPTDKAPAITEEDYRNLLNNYDNITLWKEKFPPNSYIFKGFGILNLFDVTTDQTIAEISSEFLVPGDDITERIELKMRDFFRIKDLRIGFSLFDISSEKIRTTSINKGQSFMINYQDNFHCKDFFCSHILDTVFNKNKIVTVSNVKDYGKVSQNGLYKELEKQDVGSIILIPFKNDKEKELTLIEIVSPRPYELNSINQSRLIDLLPVFKTAIERSNIEHKNKIEAIIQEKYTSIHPSVKWRFIEAAEKYHYELYEKKEGIQIDEIIFKDVYPLFGQSDIKGSSMARNKAIKEDLVTQLSLAISVLKKACELEKMPIYEELTFRVQEFIDRLDEGLKSGDETTIVNFLKRDVYPVFKHIKTLDTNLKNLVDNYIDRLDVNLQVVYEKRKEYEKSVTILNDKLSSFIDKKQKEAQAMFPHYFERYKTDGVEYNMYIGQSLLKDKKYNEVYLQNLYLWQLQLMCEMENVAMKATNEMEYELRVASLILIHSNPLAIKFRMDEKQFDVDGAYNIRYEILKKRIDKIHIKNTTERLTVPNKIAIVYAQEKEAVQYKKYIKYLQSKGQLGTLEEFELEDLQGVSGLKALRVEVIYDHQFCDKSTITIDELVKGFK